MLPIAGLIAAPLGDIITLDPVKLRAMRLDELCALMRRCGISTAGIKSHESAATRLIDRAAITSSK